MGFIGDGGLNKGEISIWLKERRSDTIMMTMTILIERYDGRCLDSALTCWTSGTNERRELDEESRRGTGGGGPKDGDSL